MNNRITKVLLVSIMILVLLAAVSCKAKNSGDDGEIDTAKDTEQTDLTDLTDQALTGDEGDDSAIDGADDAAIDGAEDNPVQENIFKEPIVLEQFQPMQNGEKYAVVTTSLGVIKVRLFPQYAPLAVENFITHADNGYYNGMIFHRVINDFMIQSGDPTGTGYGGESIYGAEFNDEFTLNLRNLRGALSMANAGENTNSSQFFIVQNNKLDDETILEFESYKEMQDELIGTVDDGTEEGFDVYMSNYYPTELLDKYIELGGTPSLDFVHTVFGQVFEGMDVVDAIAAVETAGDDGNNKPLEDVTIISVQIEFYQVDDNAAPVQNDTDEDVADSGQDKASDSEQDNTADVKQDNVSDTDNSDKK